MNNRILSFAFVCALALTSRAAVAVDPAVSTSVEAADRQFLANLQRADDVQRSAKAAETKRPEPAVAPAKSRETVVTSESTIRREPISKVVPAPRKAPERVAQAKSEELPKKQEPVEVRRAIPVETTTTIVTTTARRDRHEDRDDDGDDDGFFHRLFHGERIFR